MENKNMNEQMIEVLNSLTDAQKEKVKACKGPDEIATCLGELGVELPDELLDAVAGGYIHYSWWGGWEIVEDSTGHLLARVSDAAYNHWDAEGYVKYKALEMGQSNREISDGELERLRNQ